MKQFRIKDNSERSKEDFSVIPHIVNKVADKTFEQLENEGVFVFPECVKDSDGLTRDNMVLQSFNNSFRTGNVMGFLGYGNERLAIESRFSSSENDFFLQYLLEKVIEFPDVFDFDSNCDCGNRIFDIMVFLFPKYLKAAMRKGLFKTYICVDYNDSNPKGRIDIARNIKENIPFTGSISYNRREYSYDNYLTELIRHTIEFIKKKSYGRSLLSKAREEVDLIVKATEKYRLCDRQKVILENRKNVIRHAYFREYRILQYLCILILQNQKQEIGSGLNRIYGVLFDGAWLWEEYVNSLVGDVFYHPMNKAGKGAQRLFSGNTGLIYPDFISRNIDNRIIADAKYKPITNIGNHDYLQVLAYMMRFDAKKGLYFYPETGNEEDMYLWLNKGSTYDRDVEARDDVCLVKHGLKIPLDASDYRDFSEKMRKAENDFKKIFITFGCI